MIRNLLRLTILLVVAAAVTAVSTTEAKAHGGRYYHGLWGVSYGHGYYGTGYGYYTGYGYPRLGSGGWAYGGYTAYRGCYAPLLRRRCCLVPRYVSGCCYGGYGTEIYRYESGVIQQPQPAQAAPEGEPTPAPVPPPAEEGASLLPTGRALLTVDVPEEARVFVNGAATSTPGSHRTYASSGLTIGTLYTYQIRVEMVRDGRVVSLDRTITLRAGDTHNEVFDFNADRVAAN